MPWSGKVLGGLFGGVVGGPLGAGFGAALGHYFADEAEESTSPVRLLRLGWRHHAFGPSGPGVLVTPVWRARGLVGHACTVDVWTDRLREVLEIEPEHPNEECQLPEVLLPYADVDDPLRVSVQVRGGRGVDQDRFDVPLPSPVRRLGCSGPGRVVMALVAAARAGGRALTREDVRYIRVRVETAHGLDEDGVRWLRRWMRELRDADLGRLTAEKVAARVQPHVDPAGLRRLLGLLTYGARVTWPGEAPVRWVDAFAAALGAPSAVLEEAWAAAVPPGEAGDRRAALEVLGLDGAPTPEAVRAAWRRLARQFHPDRAISPEQAEQWTRKLVRINAAYELLGRGMDEGGPGRV